MVELRSSSNSLGSVLVTSFKIVFTFNEQYEIAVRTHSSDPVIFCGLPHFQGLTSFAPETLSILPLNDQIELFFT